MDKVTEIAKMIDHSLLHPTFTDDDLVKECKVCRDYNVATACVKPYHVKEAAKLLKKSGVGVCAVVGFPAGNSKINVKVFETEEAIKDGATEIDMVVNLGKVVSEDWKYIEKEIAAIRKVTKKHNVILKVIFENDLMPSDKHKIKLCQICSKCKVDFVKTSTGYNFVKGPDGKYFYKGATDDDLKLMRKHSDKKVQVKAAGGIGTLEALLRVKELGVTRIGAKTTAQIVEDARKMFGSCCCEK